MLFDAEGRIKHYESPEAIIADFYSLRLEYYEKRRTMLLRVCIALKTTCIKEHLC